MDHWVFKLYSRDPRIFGGMGEGCWVLWSRRCWRLSREDCGPSPKSFTVLVIFIGVVCNFFSVRKGHSDIKICFRL